VNGEEGGASARRLFANRRNARLSTGPRTEWGKSVSRNNALRHGLARPVATDLNSARAIEALTRILACAKNELLYQERDVAESLLDVQRIRDACALVFCELGEFEQANSNSHRDAANRLDKIWRYQERALAKYRNALRAYRDDDPDPR
jgi:hypothetical protein